MAAACILHHLALKNNDLMEIEDGDYDLEFSNEEINQEYNVSLPSNQRKGIDKRNELASR